MFYVLLMRVEYDIFERFYQIPCDYSTAAGKNHIRIIKKSSKNHIQHELS